MSARSVAFGVAAVVLVIVYAVGSNRWVRSGDRWYRSLEEPSWQPPDALFGVAWTYNFLALAVVGALVAAKATSGQQWSWTVVFAASVALALGWAYTFYVGHSLRAAAVLLSGAALLTMVVLVISFSVRWWMGAILVPYGVWMVLATSLSIGYLARNRAFA